MPVAFDQEAIDAAFSLPNVDGSYPPAFAKFLRELGETRRSLVLAFAPKSAGTFLRTAAVEACGGQLTRTVHSQGGRDATFYLPAWLNYFAHGFPSRTLVTHVHMQALPANRYFIEALDLRPIVMLRPITDALASYADMLDSAGTEPDNWINTRLPINYSQLTTVQKSDFLIDMVGPWFISYWSSWIEYASCDGRVLILDYVDLCGDPAAVLEDIFHHSRISIPSVQCQLAIEGVWPDRQKLRFNKGISGRGLEKFTAAQTTRLASLVDYYPVLSSWKHRLVP